MKPDKPSTVVRDRTRAYVSHGDRTLAIKVSGGSVVFEVSVLGQLAAQFIVGNAGSNEDDRDEMRALVELVTLAREWRCYACDPRDYPAATIKPAHDMCWGPCACEREGHPARAGEVVPPSPADVLCSCAVAPMEWGYRGPHHNPGCAAWDREHAVQMNVTRTRPAESP